jgi:hypothetical protein
MVTTARNHDQQEAVHVTATHHTNPWRPQLVSASTAMR